MTGMDMVTNHLLGMFGVSQQDIAAVKDELPKLRTSVPAFVAAFDAKMQDFTARLDRIEKLLLENAKSSVTLPAISGEEQLPKQ